MDDGGRAGSWWPYATELQYNGVGGVFTSRGFGQQPASQYHDPVDVGGIFGKGVVKRGVSDPHESGHDSFLPGPVAFNPLRYAKERDGWYRRGRVWWNRQWNSLFALSFFDDFAFFTNIVFTMSGHMSDDGSDERK